MAVTEKKTREWWTIYEKWAVVEALLGSGMSITDPASATVHKPINNVRQPEIPKQKMELAGNDSPPLY